MSRRTPSRREFLAVYGAGAAATLVSPAVLAATIAEDEMPIVDTHQHLWDLDRFKLPWVEPGTTLGKSFLPSDYAQATAGLNVVKSVYMEVDVDPSQQVAEAEYVIGLCEAKDNPMAAAVISGRPELDGFREYVARFADSPYIKGIRQVLHVPSTPQGYCLGKEFIAGIRLLGELGMSFDLCMRPEELPDAARLIDACPDTRFILDHCGNPNVQAEDLSGWRRDLAAIATRKHVVCKVSGIVASARPNTWTADDLAPIVNHTLDSFGPDRVMFGGDWPVCTVAATYREWVEALREIVSNRSAEEQRKLFGENALGFYRLA